MLGHFVHILEVGVADPNGVYEVEAGLCGILEVDTMLQKDHLASPLDRLVFEPL